MRSKSPKIFPLLLCLLSASFWLTSAAAARDRPNILLIVVDDMNADTVDAVIGGQPVTPRINALKDEGISFERAHVTVAVCQPSRQVLMTGLYPHQNGALGFVPIDESVTTLGEILSASWQKDESDADGTPRFSQIDNISVSGTADGVRVRNNGAGDRLFIRPGFSINP